MFKKGDVVTYCGKTEDAGFDVRVTDVDTLGIGVFYGAIISAKRGSTYEHSVSDVEHAWDVKQFKLKQQDIIGDNTPNNAFPVLKDGMVAETSFRDLYLVCGGKLIGHYEHHRVDSFNEDGVAEDGSRIIKVWSGGGMHSLEFRTYVTKYNNEVIWQEKKNAAAIAEIEEQMADLQEQLSTLQEKLVTLREEK